MKFQTFARLILSYIVSYIVKKIDFLYSMVERPRLRRSTNFSLSPKKNWARNFEFSIKRNFYFFKKKSGDLVYTFVFYDTHSPQPLLGQVFLNWIRAQKIDRLTLIVRAHLFIGKWPRSSFWLWYFYWKYDREKRRTWFHKMGRECLTFLPKDGSYRCPFVSIIKNLIRDNEWGNY
jgi:hypothetical protein